MLLLLLFWVLRGVNQWHHCRQSNGIRRGEVLDWTRLRLSRIWREGGILFIDDVEFLFFIAMTLLLPIFAPASTRMFRSVVCTLKLLVTSSLRTTNLQFHSFARRFTFIRILSLINLSFNANLMKMNFKTNSFQPPECWKIVFKIAATVHLIGCTFYAIFASGELQPWAEQPDEERKVGFVISPFAPFFFNIC